MKKYLIPLFLLVLFVQGCKSQKTINQEIMVPTVDNQFEKFDVLTFDKENVRGKRTSISEDLYIEEDTQSFGYAQQIFPSQSYFSTLKLFYKNGNIKEKGVLFNNGSEIGYWYTFDESGKLLDLTDMDEGYLFGFEQIIAYCENNEITLPKGHENSGYQTSVYKEKSESGQDVWMITHQTSGDTLDQITLDAKTGKELQRKTLEFINH